MERINSNGQNIEIGAIGESTFGAILQNYQDQKIIIIADENTHKNCAEKIVTLFEALSSAEIMVLPEGEGSKDLAIIENVWTTFSEYKISRGDLVINIGGGVITDAGGFIASCYKRGCSFINIPTSLLGMVDASIGGKTGVNLGNIKNQIGLFAHPIATFIDIEFLTTLPEEEWLNGYAEMLKHGLISNSENYDAVLEVISGRQNLSIEFLYENLKVKHNIVEEDPKEKGVRKLLNYGHTIGHALEGYFIESEFSHGWAIVCGMIMENYLSFKIGLLDKNSQDKIEKDLLTYYSLPDLTNVDLKAVIELMQHDKKNTQGKINCSLLKSVGNCTFDNYVTEEKILEVLMHYKNKQINPN